MVTIRSYPLALIFIVLLSPLPATALNLTIELDRAQVQQKMARMFPVSLENPFFSLLLKNPKVVLKEGSDRIGVHLEAVAKLPDGSSLSGNALLEGAPRLDGERNAIFLDDASVTQLHIDGIPADYLPTLQHTADALVREVLRTQPLYVLGQEGEPPMLKRKDLKAVRIHNGKLIIELAMP